MNLAGWWELSEAPEGLTGELVIGTGPPEIGFRVSDTLRFGQQFVVLRRLKITFQPLGPNTRDRSRLDGSVIAGRSEPSSRSHVAASLRRNSTLLLFFLGGPIGMAGFSVDFGHCGMDASQRGHLLQSLPVEIERARILVRLGASLGNQDEPVRRARRDLSEFLEIAVGEAFVTKPQPVPRLRVFRVQHGESLELLRCLFKPIERQKSFGEKQSGFVVTSAGDGREGLIQFRQGRFDLVVLDVMLPSLDGFEILREIRKDSQAPVVMLTARSDLHDVVVGLELGADDYVTKPFELPELVARIKAVLRRSTAEPEAGVIATDGLEIDPAAFTVRRGGEEIALTATEFKLLLELARRPKQVFTRELLLELVWNYDYLGDSRLVDAAVQRLRGKIEDDPKEPTLIRTVRGVGYKFG